MTIEQIKEMVNGSALRLVAAIPMEQTSKHPMLM